MYTEEIDKMIKAEVTSGTTPRLDIPMRRVFAECGWGFDIGERASAHEDFRKSNNLFTFYRAMVKMLFDPHDVRFEITKFMVNRLPRTGKKNAAGKELEVFEDANTSDVGMSLLVWCFWFMCGMNPSPAAGVGVAERHIEKFIKWIVENMNYIYQPGALSQTNLKKYEKLQVEVEAREKRKGMIITMKADLQKRKDELKGKVMEKKEELERLRAAGRVVRVQQRWGDFREMAKGEMKWPDEEGGRVEQAVAEIERGSRQVSQQSSISPAVRMAKVFSTSPAATTIDTPRPPRERSSSEVPILETRPQRPPQTSISRPLAQTDDDIEGSAAGFDAGQRDEPLSDDGDVVDSAAGSDEDGGDEAGD
jgi:hypothetical protein